MPIPNKTMHNPANKVTAITKFSRSRVQAHQQARNVGAALDALAKATGEPRLQLDSPLGQRIVKGLEARRNAHQPANEQASQHAAVVALCNRVIAAGQKR